MSDRPMTPDDLSRLREHYDANDTSKELAKAQFDASEVTEPMVGITIRLPAPVLDAARTTVRAQGKSIEDLLCRLLEEPTPRREPGDGAGIDEFGVPDTLFGPLPDGFFPALGRAIAVSALLEDLLRELLQQLRNEPQDSYSTTGALGLVEELRKEASARATQPDWATFENFLSRVEKSLVYRNHLAHNLWPAQPDGSLYGHRLERKSGERMHVRTSMAELRTVLADLVSLVEGWRAWFGHAGSEASQRITRGTVP